MSKGKQVDMEIEGTRMIPTHVFFYSGPYPGLNLSYCLHIPDISRDEIFFFFFNFWSIPKHQICILLSTVQGISNHIHNAVWMCEGLEVPIIKNFQMVVNTKLAPAFIQLDMIQSISAISVEKEAFIYTFYGLVWPLKSFDSLCFTIL